MKINNYSNEIKTFILYGNDSQTEKNINPYNSKAFFDTENILKQTTESYDDYYKLIINDLAESSTNPAHINAKKKKNLIFIVWVKDRYGFTSGSLYIPFNKVLKHEIIEEKKDMRGDGCVNVSYHDKIIFTDDIKILCKDSFHYFAKPNDPIRNINDDVAELADCIAKEEEHMQKYPKVYKNAEMLIKLYNEKIKEGYKYRCFSYRSVEKSYKYFMLYNCVDHYEKSPEYIKAEKLTETIKKINGKWDTDDTIKLLKIFKLTKIRK